MNIENDGMKNFPKERNLILADIIDLCDLCSNETSDLCNVISNILTICSSLKLKADTLTKILEEQRNGKNN